MQEIDDTSMLLYNTCMYELVLLITNQVTYELSKSNVSLGEIWVDWIKTRDPPPPPSLMYICRGFVQAGTISYLLYLLSTRVDGYFAKQDLPTQYTAHNVAVLIQTVVRGLMYLVTFIFAANATGLALLGIQVAIDPESVRDDGLQRRRQEERLPSVKATDDIFAIRRAFQEAEQMGKRSVQKTPNDGDSKERGDA